MTLNSFATEKWPYFLQKCLALKNGGPSGFPGGNGRGPLEVVTVGINGGDHVRLKGCVAHALMAESVTPGPAPGCPTAAQSLAVP